MSSLDKMISSNKRSSGLFTSGNKRSPDMLVGNHNLTSSQKSTVNNIKITAEDALITTKRSRRNGISIETRTLVNAPNYSMTHYKMSHKLKMFRNTNVKDPTWAQVKKFLTTNVMFKNTMNGKITWREGEFMCGDFTQTLFNNANAAGIRCADVTAIYNNKTSHALIAFNTKDRGLVFIDPTNDFIISEKNFFSQGETSIPYRVDFADFIYRGNPDYVEDITGYLKHNDGMWRIVIDW